MGHLGLVKQLLLKLVQMKQESLFTHVTQHNFVKYMWVWDQKKLDNFLQQLDKIHPL